MSTVDVAEAMWLLLAAYGLAVAVSYAGLPVLGHGAFLAVGGYGTALLGPGGEGWPLGLAVLAAVAAAAVVGWVVGLAATRLEGAYLALATWVLAWLVHRALLLYPEVTGGPDGLTRAAPARVVSPALGVELTLTPTFHIVAASLLCVLVAVALVRAGRGPAGLDLGALRESPALAASLGIPVAARRRTVLAVTAAIGALAGAGSTLLLGLVSPDDVSPLVSLELLVAVLVGGTARWWGPVLGVAVLLAVPEVADGLARAADLDAERSRGVLTAALLLLVVIARGALARRSRRAGDEPAERHPVPWAHHSGAHEEVLVAREVSVSYGAVTALDEAFLVLRTGEVHALVGPNGSGKTTLLKALAGEIPAGEVYLDGRRHIAHGPVDRVRAGVVRTPQHTVLMTGLPVDRQVAVGARGGSTTRFAAVRHLLATPTSRGYQSPLAVERAMTLTGLAHAAGADPRRLSTGDQRLLQVSRAVATGARVLLLDEPAAGMTAAERTRLAAVLRGLAGEGIAVLLVEHDMRLVGEVADWVTVLDSGRVIADGPVDQVRADPRVRLAYLGAGPAETEVRA